MAEISVGTIIDILDVTHSIPPRGSTLIEVVCVEDGIYIAQSKNDHKRYLTSRTGFAWEYCPDWTGTYEVPKCIHTLPLDVSSTTQNVGL